MDAIAAGSNVGAGTVDSVKRISGGPHWRWASHSRTQRDTGEAEEDARVILQFERLEVIAKKQAKRRDPRAQRPKQTKIIQFRHFWNCFPLHNGTSGSPPTEHHTRRKLRTSSMLPFPTRDVVPSVCQARWQFRPNAWLVQQGQVGYTEDVQFVHPHSSHRVVHHRRS